MAPNGKPLSPETTLPSELDCVTMRSSRKHNAKLASREVQPEAANACCTVPPLTPMPDLERMRGALQRLEENIKNAKSPSKTPSPNKGSFLSKYSNLTGPVEVDVSSDLTMADSTIRQMHDIFNSSMTDRKIFDESIEMFKKRGKSRFFTAGASSRPH